MRVLDLFSGIGGFALGMERAGHEVVAFCEIEEFPRKVLAKHWPNVPIYQDIRKLYRFPDECQDGDCISNEQFDREVGAVEIITGGFPCQDISNLNAIQGNYEGVEGERSGLWREALRLICALRPRWVVLENVAALNVRGLGNILAELAVFGYDAEWHSIPVAAVGGEHLRKRTWIIAYDKSLGVQELWLKGVKIPHGLDKEALSVRDSNGQWKVEPDFLRSLHGIPEKLDKSKRIKALGNSIAPQIAELIGRAIN